jgi:hypothetical protein
MIMLVIIAKVLIYIVRARPGGWRLYLHLGTEEGTSLGT